MAAIGQVDSAGIRNLGNQAGIPGIQNEEDDEFTRGADIDQAAQRGEQAPAAPATGGGQDQAGQAGETGETANVAQVAAAGQDGDDSSEQGIVRSEVASSDQQLPTPFDPNRGTQLDIAV